MRIIFYNPNNRFMRHDGDEFTARAKDCLVYWQKQGHEVKMCPLPKANDMQKRAFVRGVLDAQADESVDRIAVFGHGTSGWCDLGLTVATVDYTAQCLRRVLTADARIALYCCLTGAALNGLAARLCWAADAPVLAHKTSGHTTRNPCKRLFYKGDTGRTLTNNVILDGEVIRSEVIPFYDTVFTDLMPTDKAARKAWITKLQTDKTAPFEALEARS